MNTNKQSLLILSSAKGLYPKMQAELSKQVWDELKSQLDMSTAVLANANDQELQMQAFKVLELMASDNTTKELFGRRQNIQKALLLDLYKVLGEILGKESLENVEKHLALVLGSASFELDESASNLDFAQSAERLMTLKEGGVNGGKDIKLSNLTLNFGDLTKLGTSMIGLIQGIDSDKGILAIAAGVLGLVGALYSGMVKAVTEDEASVFWALITVAGQRDNKIATTDELNTAVSSEREKYGLKQLDKITVTGVLHRLCDRNAVKQVDEGSWQLIESYIV